MAREREVNIIVDAQNQARGTFSDVRRGLQEMDREGRRATSNFSRNFARTDRAVLSFANRLKFMDKVAKRTFQGTAAASAIYMASTLRDFAQLEDGISKVNTLYDQTRDSQRKMTQDSIQMFKLIPTDFEKITQGIYDTISAGADSKYATMISRKFGMASVAGMTEMPVVTKAAMGTMNAFGKEAQDLNHILDIQFLTVKRGITEYAQLASSLDTGILKAADSAGMTMEELYGGIAQLTKNSIPAAQATTQLGSMLARVTDPKVIKNMKEFGVELQDNHNRTKPLVEILKDLNEQFEKRKMTGAQQAGFLKEILGRQEAVRGFQTLISQVKEYGKIVDEMNHSDGTMGEAFEDRLNNINTQLKLIWNNMKAAGVEQMYALKPFLDSLTEPIITKQKLEFQKMDLQDQLMMNEDEFKKEKMSKDEYQMREKIMSESIALMDIQLNDLDITPIDKFREGLKEGVDELEKINPPLSKFVDAIGNLTLDFVGEEGTDNREMAGNVAKGLGAVYATKKLGDMYLWFRNLRGSKGKKSTSNPAESLTKTLKTMNVNANIVNVYGKSINNMGGGRFPTGGTGGIPTIVPTPVPTGTLLPGPKAIPKLPGLGAGGKLVTEAMKDSAITIAETTATEALTAFVSGIPVLAVGAIQLYSEYQKNNERDKILENPQNHTYSNLQNEWMTKDEMKKRNKQKIEEDRKNNVTISPYGSKSGSQNVFNAATSILGFMRDRDPINRNINLNNEVKVEPPKVVNKIYIDGKEIPIKRTSVTYEDIERQSEVQSRRYGRPR